VSKVGVSVLASDFSYDSGCANRHTHGKQTCGLAPASDVRATPREPRIRNAGLLDQKRAATEWFRNVIDAKIGIDKFRRRSSST